ncbi:unnamed protein product [Effrenium voratum]|nr:unnamed protein product [Effrenium voratum]
MITFPECCVCDHIDKGEENFVAAKAPQEKKHASTPPEKARLQEFVKDFAKCAIRGVPCRVLDPKTGQTEEAAYFLDPQIQRMMLKRPQTPETVLASIRVENIKDVVDADAGVSQAISKAEADRLAVLTFRNGEPSIFLLEGTVVDRDRFVMCVKILRLYAQMQAQRATEG